MDTKKPPNNIKFWTKDTGNFMSHKSGLGEYEIAFLQSLKVGDRLIGWSEPDTGGTMPTLTLKKFEPRTQASPTPIPGQSTDIEV